jgi:NAD(P)-dependent dehydrogenase (short-subunit alcohol dehydrogenase family)
MTTPKGTVLVTGTNGGLGSAIVADILKKPDIYDNYTGVYTVRKASTAEQLNKVLEMAPKSHKHQVIDLDLSSIAKVRKVATTINDKVASGELPPIRSLILNAAWQEHAEMVCFRVDNALVFAT